MPSFYLKFIGAYAVCACTYLHFRFVYKYSKEFIFNTIICKKTQTFKQTLLSKNVWNLFDT